MSLTSSLLKMIVGSALALTTMIAIGLMTWLLITVQDLTVVTVRLDERLIAFGKQIDHIKAQDARIDALERRTGALERKG